MAHLSLAEQFEGFIHTSPIFSGDSFFEIPQFHFSFVPPPGNQDHLREPPTGVLGKRMEYFFQYYITTFTRYEILAANQQVIHENRTLGEFDYILKDPKDGSLTHVELVYKFYLYVPGVSNDPLRRWIGPNRKDSFIQKITRLQQRQFPLLHRKESRPVLKNLNLDSDAIQQKVCFLANLFLPQDSTLPTLPPINPRAVKGCWMSAQEFEASRFQSCYFYTPAKKYWPVNPSYNKTWLPYEPFRSELQILLDTGRSPLVWMKNDQEQYFRFFVVNW